MIIKSLFCFNVYILRWTQLLQSTFDKVSELE